MVKNSRVQLIDVDRLSTRERDVVARAVEGYTDEQIAQALGIGLGTVNTYWVRIRAKIGQFTRTEIVAGVLRAEMQAQLQDLRQEIADLKEAAAEEDEPWRFKCLGHLCDAALVVDQAGSVVYANPHARDLLGADRHELEGLPFWELTASEEGKSCRQSVHEFFADQNVRRRVVGLDKPYYALRRDGSKIRVTIAAEWFESPDGIIASVSIREYLNGLSGHAKMM